MQTVARLRTPGVLLTLLGSLATVCLLVHPPGARASGPTKADATVVGHVEIDWTGTKGVLLQVRQRDGVPAPQEAFHLYLQGGTYAFVRYMSSSGCAGLPRCGITSLTHDPVDSLAWRQAGGRPGEDFFYIGSDPALIGPGLNEVYLFTDGRARLVYDNPALPGRVRLTASRHVRGEAKRLSGPCTVDRLCSDDTALGKLDSGGAVHDFGSTSGVTEYVTATAVFGARTPLWQSSYGKDVLLSRTGCMYPSGVDPQASPDPARHPQGCDVTPISFDTADPGSAANPNAPFAWLNENQSWVCWTALACIGVEAQQKMTGKSYVGYRSYAVTPEQSHSDGFGIWYTYGIR